MSASNVSFISGPADTAVVDCREARLTIRSGHGLTTIIITGEIYASNADDICRRVRGLVSQADALIVDLGSIDFIGLAGLRVLLSLNIECLRTDTPWALIVGHSTARLLRVGDPDGILPTVDSTADALRLVRGGAAAHQSTV